MRKFLTDLHIHTCLSPCAEMEMLPSLILARAKEAGLDAIGITDHNSAENTSAIRRASAGTGVSVIMGMEITSMEEVHVLAYFDDEDRLFKMQEMVYGSLPGVNDEERFGQQIVVDSGDDPIDICERLLIGATTLPLGKIVETIHRLKGLAIASHIDRPAFSILGQLGFIPEDLELDAVEVFSPDFTGIPKGHRAIFSSDAHRLADIGKNRTEFWVENISVDELKKALKGEDGRSFTPYPRYS